MVQRKDLDEWFGTLSASQTQIHRHASSLRPFENVEENVRIHGADADRWMVPRSAPISICGTASSPFLGNFGKCLFLQSGLTHRETITNPGIEVTFLNRSFHPVQKGLRLGLGIMDGETNAVNATSDKTERRRALMPQAAGLLHLELFRGRIRPFVEGEAGVASTLLDVRTFDELDERTSYSIPSFDATLFYGWATGLRIAMMDGQGFLVLRCGNRFGGQLARHAIGDEPEGSALLAGRRSSASIGISLTL